MACLHCTPKNDWFSLFKKWNPLPQNYEKWTICIIKSTSLLICNFHQVTMGLLTFLKWSQLVAFWDNRFTHFSKVEGKFLIAFLQFGNIESLRWHKHFQPIHLTLCRKKAWQKTLVVICKIASSLTIDVNKQQKW